MANVVPRPPRSSYNLLNLRETVLVSATYVGESVKGRAVEQPARERGRIASAWSDGDGVGSAKTFTSGAGRRGATERVVAWNGQRQSRSRALVGRLLEATENIFNLKRRDARKAGAERVQTHAYSTPTDTETREHSVASRRQRIVRRATHATPAATAAPNVRAAPV